MLKAEHCPGTYEATLPNGNRIRAGKEYDRRGRLVAFWFCPEHPHDHWRFTVADAGCLIRAPPADEAHNAELKLSTASRNQEGALQG